MIIAITKKEANEMLCKLRQRYTVGWHMAMLKGGSYSGLYDIATSYKGELKQGSPVAEICIYKSIEGRLRIEADVHRFQNHRNTETIETSSEADLFAMLDKWFSKKEVVQPVREQLALWD